MIEAHAVGWNKRDARAAAAVMHTNGVWVTSSGVVLRGRAEIEGQHARWLAQDSATGGSTHVHRPESVVIRFLRPDVAVVDLEGQFIAGTGSARDSVIDRSLLFIVLTKDGGQWRIAELRNTGKPSR